MQPLARDSSGLLRTDCAYDVLRAVRASLSPQNVNAPPPPCKSSGDSPLPAYFAVARRGRSRTQGAVDGIVPFCFYRHPALVRRSCATPSMAARAPSSRRPVSTRSLRCGLRSSCLVTTPSLRSVATTRLHATSLTSTIGKRFLWAKRVCFIDALSRFTASCRVPPGGIVPPGLVMRRPSRSPCLRRVRSTQAGGFLPKIATHFVCVAVASLRCAQECAVVASGGIPPKVAMASCHRRSRFATRDNASEHQRAL